MDENMMNPEMNQASEVPEEGTPQENTQKVVVYPAETIQNILAALDGKIPVKGIDTMRGVVEVFDVLNQGGVVQDAVDMGNSGYGNPEGTFQPEIIEPPADAESGIVGEETEVYNPEMNENA